MSPIWLYPESTAFYGGDRFQATIGCEYGSTLLLCRLSRDYQIGSGAVKTFGRS